MNQGTDRIYPTQGGEPGEEHDSKGSPKPVRCMSGDVAVTTWRIGIEGTVVPGVHKLVGHGEENETMRMGDSLAYKWCS